MAENRSRYEELREAFEAFHVAHPKVWSLFLKFSLELMQRGFRQYSANAVFERIRWETDQADYDGVTTFKLNNNLRPFYARKFNDLFGIYFFRTRGQTSKEAPPVCMPQLGPKDFDGVTS